MKKTMSLLLCVILLCGFSTAAYGVTPHTVQSLTEAVGAYLYQTVPSPQIGSVGGEWTVLGLAESDIAVPSDYYDQYYKRVENKVLSCGGVLHERKYTEYARVALALTAIGKNPQDVGGYNLLMPLADYEKTTLQGINGAIWALIALDCGNYAMPQNKSAVVQATRTLYVQYILNRQTEDGGWALSGNTADADITAMALQALSGYRENRAVQTAVEKALTCMSAKQTESGGFLNRNAETAESSAQMLVALCALDIPITDARFVKNGHTVLDGMLGFSVASGGFCHTKADNTFNLMATEQCFYALVALQRVQNGKSKLYDMRFSSFYFDDEAAGEHSKKCEDVRQSAVLYDEKSFSDIQGHVYRSAIEALAVRGIVSGQTEDCFEPNSTMTRAEFAAIVVKGLGLPAQVSEAVFSDVPQNTWFAPYVYTAYAYGVLRGVGQNQMNPGGTVTREEAAVMLVRAAALCGADTAVTSETENFVLEDCSDAVLASDWARQALCFCRQNAVLPQGEPLKPKDAVTRAEIAGMLYGVLSLTNLL